MTAEILITTSKVLTLDLEPSNTRSQLPPCDLKWRQKKLWITKAKQENFSILPALNRQQWLQKCLRQSPVTQICLDPQIGETGIKIWADVSQKANKKAFLRLSSDRQLLVQQQSTCWRIKRVFDWIAAALLLLIFSPLMLTITVLIKLFSPGPVLFGQWRVGKRGRLFKVYKFRTMIIDAEKLHHQVMGDQQGLHKREDDPRITLIGRWLRKYSLDELPQLFNVVRGEMSLVGPRPWALYDAFRLGEASKQRLNALPGITGAWQVESRSQLLDLESVTKCDLDYLRNWSLKQDFKILLLTVPRVISGLGAY